jgi:hypothetical protein
MELMPSMDSVCAKSDDIVARQIEDDIVIVPLVAGMGDTDDELYTLNATGRAIWDRIDGAATIAEIVASLSGEYDSAPGELESDVLGFTGELVRRGFLVSHS